MARGVPDQEEVRSRDAAEHTEMAMARVQGFKVDGS